MSPLLRKEIRLLLPFWGIAMLLALVPAWIFPRESFAWHSNQSPFWAFGFGVTLLALAPFGQEFSFGTFSSLLAQPFERNRIWRTKMLLILIAVAIVLIAFMLSIYTRLGFILSDAAQRMAAQGPHDYLDLQINELIPKNWAPSDIWRMSFLLAAVAVGGGFWTTLLFRQIGAALWFTILVPGAIFIAVQILLLSFSWQAQELTLAIVLTTYSTIGFFWARRMFLSAQDSQWLGETISLLALTQAKTSNEPSSTGRGKKPLRALLRKEFQSHQISLLVGFGLFVLHACTLAFRKFYTLPSNSELRFTLEAVPFLWLLLPWVMGSVAVAEERKLGMMETQLCLPITRRRQFAIKFSIVLLLGIVLGGIIPWLVEQAAITLHVPSGVITADSLATNPGSGSALVILCAIAALIAIVSFFASTLTGNTLHALGASIVFGGAFWLLFVWTRSESLNSYGYSLWNGPLIFFIGLPVAVLTVTWMSWSNYKLLQPSGSAWIRSLLVLCVSLFLSGVATALIYQRPWELFMALEPKHGPPSLTGPIRPALRSADDRIVALLPDGRLWVAVNYHWQGLNQYEEEWNSAGHTNQLREIKIPVPKDGQFVRGSNWVSVAASSGSGEVVALQSDGSLWRILSLRDATNSRNWKLWLSLMPEPRKIGSENNWKSVVASGSAGFMALKTDGTLWGWGYGFTREGELVSGSSGYIREPVRIGTNSDWAAIFSDKWWPYFMKQDGAIWERSRAAGQNRDGLNRTYLNGSDWLAIGGSHFFLHKDGTLWASGYLPRIVFGAHTRSWPNEAPLHRIGRDSDWEQIAASDRGAIAIKKNGELVESDTELFSATLGQPSKYSDWLAIEENQGRLAALAADGTLSFWLDYSYYRGAGYALAQPHTSATLEPERFSECEIAGAAFASFNSGVAWTEDRGAAFTPLQGGRFESDKNPIASGC